MRENRLQSPAPLTKIVISDHGVEVHGHVHVLEVPLSGRVSELPVVPVHDRDAVRFALREVVGQVVADTAGHGNEYIRRTREYVVDQ